jgi:hypothetical protein
LQLLECYCDGKQSPSCNKDHPKVHEGIKAQTLQKVDFFESELQRHKHSALIEEMNMEPLYPWHRLAADVAHAYGLSDSSELEMATQLNRAIQIGTIRCWKMNGDPIKGPVPQENMRNPVPHLTVTEGNAWLKRAGYLQDWAPAKDHLKKNGTRIRWTEDESKRLCEYRKNHTEKQTAEHFKVSGTRVREIMAKAKSQAGTQTARKKGETLIWPWPKIANRKGVRVTGLNPHK